MKIRKIFHILAVIYKPVLKVFGVKDKIVASKVGDVVEVVDKNIPTDK